VGDIILIANELFDVIPSCIDERHGRSVTSCGR
jgi:SAM-dependent MidA family methyltransferase